MSLSYVQVLSETKASLCWGTEIEQLLVLIYFLSSLLVFYFCLLYFCYTIVSNLIQMEHKGSLSTQWAYVSSGRCQYGGTGPGYYNICGWSWQRDHRCRAGIHRQQTIIHLRPVCQRLYNHWPHPRLHGAKAVWRSGYIINLSSQPFYCIVLLIIPALFLRNHVLSISFTLWIAPNAISIGLSAIPTDGSHSYMRTRVLWN